MKNRIAMLCLISALVTGLTAAASITNKSDEPSPAPRDTVHTAQPMGDPGEQVFMSNCSRCHAAPMTLSPRVTGTVIMHMRARARLSRHDERLLLKFLAP